MCQQISFGQHKLHGDNLVKVVTELLGSVEVIQLD